MPVDYLVVYYPSIEKLKLEFHANLRLAEKALADAADADKPAAIVISAQDLEPMSNQVLIAVYNALVPEKPINKFETRKVGCARIVKALQDRQKSGAEGEATTNEENGDVSKTTTKKKATKKPKAERAPRQIGKPAKRAAELGQVRAGTARAKVLKAMDGKHTTAAIAKLIEQDEARVLAHAYCLWRDIGVGYELNDESKLVALYPAGKGFDDVIRVVAEK